jgi:hypothetical protein
MWVRVKFVGGFLCLSNHYIRYTPIPTLGEDATQ